MNIIKCWLDGKLSDECDISDCNNCKRHDMLRDNCQWKKDGVCIASDSFKFGEECFMSEIGCTWLEAIRVHGGD